MKDTERYQELAVSSFRDGFNCAESCLLAMAAAWDLPAEAVPGAATAFGGGVGRTGSVCGTVTGVLMALGMKAGHKEASDTETKERVTEQASGFVQRFRKEAGAVDCRLLTGCDFTREKEHQRYKDENIKEKTCVDLVRMAVRLGIETLS